MVAPVGQLPSVIRGRDELLTELTAAMERNDGSVFVLHGLGGSGKTTVALEVARRAQVRARSADDPADPAGAPTGGRAAWWVSAASAAASSAGMRQLAVELGADTEQLRLAWSGQASASDLVWRLLNERSDAWVLVVDNADDLDLLTSTRTRVASLADLALVDLAARPGPDPDDPLAYTLSLHPLVRATSPPRAGPV